MNSLFKLIFLSLQQRIAAATEIRFIVEDTGQLRDEKPALSYPAVVIDMNTASLRSLGRNVQEGTIMITVKVVTVPYSYSAANTPDAYREKGLKYYDNATAIHQALQGWAPSCTANGVDLLGDITGSLDRVIEKTDRSRDDLRIRELTYSLGIEDNATLTLQQYFSANNITLSITPVIQSPGIAPEAVVIDL